MKKMIYIIGSIMFIIDQCMKGIVTNFITYQEVIDIIPNFFYLTYVKNTGGAWSILSNSTLFLLLISFLCIGFLFYYIGKKNDFNKLEIVYFGLITGGILGNLWDRLIYKSVIDFIGLIFGNYYFPVFNFADICIVCGGILLIIDSFKGDKNGNRSN